MSHFWADLRYAARSLARAPLFTAVVVATLALGIGANSAIFSIVNAVLMNGLPFERPEQLVHMQVRSAKGYLISVSLPNYHDWVTEARSFTALAGTSPSGFNLTSREGAERIQGTVVMGDLFGTLGIKPLLGRAWSAAETERGAAPTAVLSYALWQRRFAGSRAVLGQNIILDDRSFTIIGVASRAMVFPDPSSEIFVSMGAFSDYPWDIRDAGFGMEVVGRLRAGVTIAAAQRDMDRVAREIQERTAYKSTVPIQSLRDNLFGGMQPTLYALSGAVALILLIACANIGGLLVARGESRQRELALRSALGASTSRMVRQLLTETLVLAVAGGTLGIGLAALGVQIFGKALPPDLPLLPPTHVSGAAIAFTAVLTLFTALLFGLLPALRASRAHKLAEALISGGGARAGDSGARLRFRAALVTGEIALSLVLLVGAALVLRSVMALRNIDPGFDATNVLTLRLAPSDAKYGNAAQWLGMYDQVLNQVRTLPGVTAVGLNNTVPLYSGGFENGALPEGRADGKDARESALVLTASSDYFRTMGIKLVRGRYFTDADSRMSTPVAVIDETMAQKFWPGEDPIGKRVTWEPGPMSAPPWREVVGVVRNIHYYQLQAPARITAYRPVAQATYQGAPDLYLFVKTSGDPRGLIAPVRKTIQTIDPSMPIYRVQTMRDVLDRNLATSHLLEQLLGLFAALALVLAALGTYGLISYTVARRSRELGIRMALGATAEEAMRLVMRRGVAIIGVGLAAGVVVSAIASRALSASLYGVKPLDPLTYLAASVMLAIIAIAACWLPARRATRIAPGIALRSE
jgi:putative ABC transport system permease protein